jgi:4-amino-4-deoxy-L-arabinose transferase-like glycosyltransferase
MTAAPLPHQSASPALAITLRRWYAWAALCFVPTLFFYYVGEEGVFTLNALEMWQRGEYWRTVMYGALDGGGNGRPPLFNWLIIPLAQCLGWPQMLLASRIVTVVATLLTSLTVAWLAQQLWHERAVTWMAALLYLCTADVLLYRGWLAYADPLFALFVVLAIALTWVACLRAQYRLLLAAALAAFAAVLTKALTVYVFWFSCTLVLSRTRSYRQFLLAPRAWACYALGAAPLLLWFALGTHTPQQSTRLVGDVLARLAFTGWADYATHLFGYPLEMGASLLPGSYFVALIAWRRWRNTADTQALDAAQRASLGMALLCIAPYWLAPSGGPRYVLPVYALLVLPTAYLALHALPFALVRRWVLGLLTLATLLNLLVYPYYQRTVRGANYERMALQIVQHYGAWPLYATNVTSAGLSVVAHIDTLRWPQAAVAWPAADFVDGIVIAHAASDFSATVLGTLKVDNDSVLLLCRGRACDADGAVNSRPPAKR